MLFDRPSRADLALNDYWNALNAGAPGEELERLAAEVEPTELAALHRARTSKQRYAPDPYFVRRLEETLMNIAVSNTAGTIPHERTGSIGSLGPNRGRSRAPRPMSRQAIGRRLTPAVAIIAVAVMLLGILGGIWYLSQNETPNQVVPAGTPEPNLLPDVSMYRGNAARTGEMPGPAIAGQPHVLWTFRNSQTVETSPALVNGLLYFSGGTAGVIALDAATGAQRWVAPFGVGVNAPLAVADGLVFAVGSDGVLVALDAASGEERWNRAGVRADASPLVDDGVLYVDGAAGVLLALDVETGAERWSANLPDEISRSPSLADGRVFVTAAGRVHALDSADGALLWSWESGNPGALIFEPAVSSGTVFLGAGGPPSDSRDGFAAAIDAETGETIWLLEGEGYSRPTVSGATIWYVTLGNDVVARRGDSGELLWRNEAVGESPKGPTIAGQVLYVGTRGGDLLAFDATTGGLNWRLELDSGIEYPPVVSGGLAFVGTGFGTIYAIGSDPDTIGAPASAGNAAPATPAVASFDPAALALTWEASEELGRSLYGLAISPLNGNIYVVNTDQANISVFSPDGTLIETWGGPGNGPGEFRFLGGGEIAAIDFDADGNIYVFDAYNQRIQKFTPEHDFIMAWGSLGTGDGQFGSLSGAVDRVNGLVYALDNEYSTVQVFDLDGAFIRKWGSFGVAPGQFVWPMGAAVAPDGTLFISDQGTRRIQHFTPEGELIAVVHMFAGAEAFTSALAIDQHGNLWAPTWNGNAILVFSPDGAVIGDFGEIPGVGSLLSPEGIVFDGDGNMYLMMDGRGFGQLIKLDTSAIYGG